MGLGFGFGLGLVRFPSTCAQRMTARMMSRCAASEAGMPSLRARATMATA